MHFDPAVPGDLKHRIRELLQPRLVGAAAIVQRRVREDDDGLLLNSRRSARFFKRGSDRGQIRSQTHGARRRGAVDTTKRELLEPKLIGVVLDSRTNLSLEILLECPSLARELENDVAGGPRIEHRLHHRLLQRRDAGPRPAGAPLLEGWWSGRIRSQAAAVSSRYDE